MTLIFIAAHPQSISLNECIERLLSLLDKLAMGAGDVVVKDRVLMAKKVGGYLLYTNNLCV